MSGWSKITRREACTINSPVVIELKCMRVVCLSDDRALPRAFDVSLFGNEARNKPDPSDHF